MDYRIRVVALPGCEMCSSLIDKLKSNSEVFTIVNAEEHDSLCDMLEVLLKTKMYPIVTYEIPQRAYFICMPSESDRLGWKVLDDSSTSIGVTNVDNIYDTIKELKQKL